MQATMNVKTHSALMSAAQQRLSSLPAAALCQSLHQPARRRQHAAICHATDEISSNAANAVRSLTQQYQGLLTPAKPKPSSSSASSKKAGQNSTTQSSKAAKQGDKKGTSSSSSSGSANPPGKAGAAAKHSGSSKSAASDRSQTQPSKRSSSSSSNSSKDSSKASSRSSSRVAKDAKSKQKPSKQPAAAAAPLPPLVLSGKGFGTVAPTPSSTTTTTSSSSNSSSKGSNSKTLKLFRFAVEAAAIQLVIQQNGWENRVEQVETLKEADLVVSCKCTPGGKHQNLEQGQRAAANANIPFVVIGRRISKNQFYKEISPYLNVQTPEERAAIAAEAQQRAESKAFADQWFKAAKQVQWGNAVPAAAGNAAAALEQHSQQQKVAAQVQSQKQQQQQAAGGSNSRSSSSRGLTR